MQPVDWNRIAALKGEIGDEALDDVLRGFLAEMDRLSARLREDLPDPASLHALKGVALSVGFRRLGELCDEGEALLRSDTHAKIDIDGITAAYIVARSQLASIAAD